MVCREPYANTTSSTVDSPISSQYDEMDALLIFDNVFVPWERVLLYNNPEAIWSIKSDTASSSLAFYQCFEYRLPNKARIYNCDCF